MKEFRFRGHRVAYIDEGSGAPIVFCHNGGISHRLFDHQIAHFRDARRVIAMDWLGFGASDKPDIAYDADLYVAQLEALIGHLKLERFDLVGCCVGGSIGIFYALAHPEKVRSLTVITIATPATTRPGILGGSLFKVGSLKYWVQRICGSSFLGRWFYWPAFQKRQLGQTALQDTDFRDHVRRNYATPGVGRAFAAYDYMSHEILDTVDRPQDFPPLLVIWGEDNTVLHAKEGRQLAAHWRADETLFVPGCGYMVMREAPDLVNRTIEDFLAKVHA